MIKIRTAALFNYYTRLLILDKQTAAFKSYYYKLHENL